MIGGVKLFLDPRKGLLTLRNIEQTVFYALYLMIGVNYYMNWHKQVNRDHGRTGTKEGTAMYK